MWNAKRVLLLFAGFLLFFTGFGVYAHYLGGIDGLPPLPRDYWPGPSSGPAAPLEASVEGSTLVHAKLLQAFGPRSDVLDLPIKVEVSPRGMVLATEDFLIDEHDGRVKMSPFRIALFGKTAGPTGVPEINTISCDTAYLTLSGEKHITNITEIGSRKILATELTGNVTVVNNRRTPQPDDDLTLFTQGPVYYRADKNFIYTLEPVRLEDKQSKPKPMVVTATGMDVYLTADSNPPGQGPPAGHKNPNSSVSGVKSVSLRSLVEMDLYVDSRSGFLAAGKSDAKPAAPPPPEAKNPNPKAAPAVASKSHITIRTEGPFDYNVLQDYAEFHTSQSPSSLPKGVDVTREHEDGQWDHLLCDHLILQFHRKENPQAPAPTSATDSRNLDLEIENAHATADLGKEIFLSSNKEALDAFGKDLYYDARTHTTILKGETGPMFPLATSFRPMKAVKDLNVIYARELQMVEGPTGREATALGPGKIDLWDKKTKSYPLHAQWKDKLVSSKDGGFDCLTLTGEAVFQDEEHDQSLRGDSLKVWFTPNDQADTNHGDAAHGDPNATVAPQQRVKPQHVEARGHVLVNSPELHVQGPTERLVIWFKDTVVNAQLPGSTSPPGDKIPATSSSPPQPASPAGEPAPAGAPTQATASTTPAPAVPAENKKETPPAATAAASPGTAPPEKPKKPMFLSARSIEAYVLRGPTKSDLDRLWCEGTVRVLQEGETPEDKGVDIRGETLQMHHYTEGNVLVVTGRLALVQMNQTSILGPEVTIDQKTNVAQVNGLGVMKLPASNDFGGRPLAHAAEITIVWRDSMLFDGKCAEFHGDIQAKQQNSRLLCQEMQVFLDRAISFKEGDRGRQPAKVQKLLCDKQVFVEDKTLQGTQLVNYKRLTTPVVSFDNEEGKVTAAGPGLVHILQPGSDEDPLLNPTTPNSGPKPAPARGKEKDKDAVQLTRVSFRDQMYANNTTRTAIFYGDVKVVHLPTENPDVRVDLDHPPQGLLYLSCERLKVFTDAQKSQQLEAETRVVVQAQDFWGQADVVKYDEGKELVIFEGTNGNLATLYRVRRAGAEPEKLTGRKLYYWRRTQDVKIDGGEVISGSS